MIACNINGNELNNFNHDDILFSSRDIMTIKYELATLRSEIAL